MKLHPPTGQLIQVLNPNTCERDLIRKSGLGVCN